MTVSYDSIHQLVSSKDNKCNALLLSYTSKKFGYIVEKTNPQNYVTAEPL